MDRSRQKRPEIQTQRQTAKISFGNSQLVPRVVPGRIQNARPKAYNLATPPRTTRSLIHSDEMYKLRSPQSQLPNQVVVSTPPPNPVRSGLPANQQPNITVASLASRTPIDMALPTPDSPLHEVQFMQRKKWHKTRLIAARTTAVVLVLLITLGGLLFSQSYFKLNKVFKGSTSFET
jgi:hypothetical protein